MRIFNRKRTKIPEEVEVPIEKLIAELPEESRIFLRSWQCIKDTALKTDENSLYVVCSVAIDVCLRTLVDIGYISEAEKKRLAGHYAVRGKICDEEGEVAVRAMRYMTNVQALLKKTGW